MNQHFKDNIIFVAVAVIAFWSDPAIAQNQSREYDPINFTQKLNFERGSLSPRSEDAIYLSHSDTCRLVRKEFGWSESQCDEVENIVFGYLPNIDNLIVNKPTSDGFVKFDDWEDRNIDDEIEVIWNSYVEGLASQSAQLGVKITAVDWYVYPTLKKNKGYMYYAVLLDWDGEKTLNVNATLFDRKGFINFGIVPIDPSIGKVELEKTIDDVLVSYKPTANQSYIDFSPGDKVAAVGAVGVLASLLGVKYGKAAASGLIAILLVFAKKLWFLLFLPLVLIPKLFRRKKEL